MSRYVSRISCVLCLLTVFSVLFISTPSHAAGEVYYNIVGTNYKVTPGGTDANNVMSIICPLRKLLKSDSKTYQKAVEAARAAGDKDGAAYMVSPTGKKFYFDALLDCENFFAEQGVKSGSADSPNPSLSCGHLAVGSLRDGCADGVIATTDSANNMSGAQRLVSKTLNAGGVQPDLSKEQVKKMQEDEKALEAEEQKCFEGTLGRIGEYWGKQRGVQCVKVAKRFITKNIKKQITQELNHFETKLAVNLKSDAQGTSPGAIISMLSWLGAGQALVSAAKYAYAIIKVATDNAADLDFLLNDCLKISDDLKQLQSWKSIFLVKMVARKCVLNMALSF